MNITIPEAHWKETGPDEYPWARLLYSPPDLADLLTINGSGMHLEAFAVDDNGGIQCAVAADWAEPFFQYEETCFETTTIRGREYFLVVLSHAG